MDTQRQANFSSTKHANILQCFDLALKPLARLSLPRRYGLPRNHNLLRRTSPGQECGYPLGT